MKGLISERGEQVLAGCERLNIAADHHDRGALPELGAAAGDGGVEVGNAERGQTGCKFRRAVRVTRGRIDHDVSAAQGLRGALEDRLDLEVGGQTE